MDTSCKKNIAIIGLGEIGSRHLQALADINIACSLFAVDPSMKSTSVAKSRFQENLSNHELDINFLNSVDDLPKQLGLVIIATTSDIRLNVLESLLTNIIKIENIIMKSIFLTLSTPFFLKV